MGNDERSLELFVDALLAMDPEGPEPPWGIPRLIYFAWGPNLAPFSEEERARRLGSATHDMTRSAGWSFIGGSPLLGSGTEGKEFGEWLVGVAKEGKKP